MPSFAVLQPDGHYARFSTVVDSFTHCNQTRDEALAVWQDEVGSEKARGKLANAEAEEPSSVSGAPGPLARWRGCLEHIAIIHGEKFLRETLAEFSLTDAERARWIEEAFRG